MKKGSKHTEEAKRKNKEAHKGKLPWNKNKTKKEFPQMSNSGVKKGTRHYQAEETRKKISKNHKKESNPKGIKRSIQFRKKMSEITKQRVLQGTHNNYKGGITDINEAIRNTLEYKLWREAVFKRDNYQCIWGSKEHGSNLEVDHIQEFALYPELRFAIDNGRTLCKNCHKKRHKKLC